LGIGPNPQSPIPNPHLQIYKNCDFNYNNNTNFNKFKNALIHFIQE
jgi:hypothetical protein